GRHRARAVVRLPFSRSSCATCPPGYDRRNCTLCAEPVGWACYVDRANYLGTAKEVPMDWLDTPAQAGFRDEVRSLIERGLPERYRRSGEVNRWQSDRASEDPEARAAALEWSRVLGEKGWIAPHWPVEYGGAGMTPMEQFIFNEEMAKAG